MGQGGARRGCLPSGAAWRRSWHRGITVGNHAAAADVHFELGAPCERGLGGSSRVRVDVELASAAFVNARSRVPQQSARWHASI